MPTQEKQVQGHTGSQMAQKNGIHQGDNEWFKEKYTSMKVKHLAMVSKEENFMKI